LEAYLSVQKDFLQNHAGLNRPALTLIQEFQAVPRMPSAGRRLLDALILPTQPKRQAHWREVQIEGQEVIVVQAKAQRLGMYLMGQGIFSAELIRRRFRPKSVRSVILCIRDDAVLRSLLQSHPEVEVVILSSEDSPTDQRSERSRRQRTRSRR
jgi:hypothetical protein